LYGDPFSPQYKDSREHFEKRTHKRLYRHFDPTPKAVAHATGLRPPTSTSVIKLVDESWLLLRQAAMGTKLSASTTQVWDVNNKLIPVTVVEITRTREIQLRSEEVDGHSLCRSPKYGQIDPRKGE
jgi:hypothetical protein